MQALVKQVCGCESVRTVGAVMQLLLLLTDAWPQSPLCPLSGLPSSGNVSALWPFRHICLGRWAGQDPSSCLRSGAWAQGKGFPGSWLETGTWSWAM